MAKRLVLAFLTCLLAAGWLLAAEGPLAPAPAPAKDPEKFVLEACKALLRGDPGPLADALDLDALLERALADLSARPPKIWLDAARLRLEQERRAAAEYLWRRGMAQLVPPGPTDTGRGVH